MIIWMTINLLGIYSLRINRQIYLIIIIQLIAIYLKTRILQAYLIMIQK